MTQPSPLPGLPRSPELGPSTRGRGRYLVVWTVLLVLWGLVAVALYEPVMAWLGSEDRYDQDVLVEWLEETRGFRETLPEMVDHFLQRTRELEALPPPPSREGEPDPYLSQRELAASRVAVAQGEIYEHLQTLGNPPTKMFTGQLPLFPVIYRLEIQFENKRYTPIVWDSELPYNPGPDPDHPAQSSQYKELHHPLKPGASVRLIYQLHAFNKRQQIEQEHQRRLRQVGLLAGAATLLAVVWLALLQRREAERERHRSLAQKQADEAERLLLQEEKRHEETERNLLEQRLAAQAAEQRVLELKSQLYASISIMAGSYAHNIKNLLVRPNDLLRRCLEAEGLSADQSLMLHEVRQTLGTVTERLQQILKTVRRDPSRSEQTPLDLNAMVRELQHTWKDLGRDKWKLEIDLDLAGTEPVNSDALLIQGDLSHLQQAVENLLFNARDATFEMRNHLRDAARRDDRLDAVQRRQALIAAASWRGRVQLRTRRTGNQVVLEVCDNGAGMTEEVVRRCTETHFSTKRDNAIYEGHSTGMGLGLAFVVTILEHHKALLEIESEPYKGTTFRVRFPTLETRVIAAESETP
jgi:signal transduction histidine kinase